MIRMVAVYIMVFVCATASVDAAQSTQPLRLSLRDALTTAHERHAQIIMADERVEQAVARLGQSASGLLPQLRGVMSGARQSRDLRGQGISLPGDPHIGPFNSFDARLKMTQAIFDPAAIARLNAASKNKELSLAERAKVEEDVLALVATLYINASQALDDLESKAVILKSDQHAFKIVKARVTQGTASALELDEAKSRYKQSYFQWSRAKTEEAKARLDLCAALDLPMDRKIEYVTEDLFADIDQEDLLSVDDHPDIQAAQKDLDLKIAKRGVEISEWLPQVTALADYGKSGESPDESSRTYTVGLQATVPIWEGGNRENRIKEAASSVSESEARLHQVERETKARVMTAFETIDQSRAFIRLANADVKAADRQAALAKRKFEIGQGNQQDVLDGAAQQAAAHATESDALAAYQLAQVNLAHALGRMEELVTNQGD